jgi:hypothetical protein
MATVTPGYVFTSTEQVTSTKLASLASGTVSAIVGGDITNGTIDLSTKVTGTLAVGNGGTGATSSTGTGNVVLATAPTIASPVLTTPVLGTPSSGTLTSCTGLPLTTGVTGVLPIANMATGTPTGAKFIRDDGTLQVASAFTKTFTSADQTITAGGALTLAHSLGAKPFMIQAFLKCATAELNYSIGDEYPIPWSAESSSNNRGISCVPDATNLNIRIGSEATNTFTILDKTSGAVSAMVNTKWTLVFRAAL